MAACASAAVEDRHIDRKAAYDNQLLSHDWFSKAVWVASHTTTTLIFAYFWASFLV